MCVCNKNKNGKPNIKNTVYIYNKHENPKQK